MVEISPYRILGKKRLLQSCYTTYVGNFYIKKFTKQMESIFMRRK